MNEEPGWKAILRVNASFLRASAALAIAWACWEASGAPGFEPLVFMAGVAAIVFVKHGAIGLARLIGLIRRQWRSARFRAKGAAPKADRTASEADLRKAGITR